MRGPCSPCRPTPAWQTPWTRLAARCEWGRRGPHSAVRARQSRQSGESAAHHIAGLLQSNAGPLIATGGKDGAVRVWDAREPSAPVAAFVPAGGAAAADCWSVALGNCHSSECCVLAGYQNGDIKMFDLKAASVRWETNVGRGVCGVQVRGAGRQAAR